MKYVPPLAIRLAAAAVAIGAVLVGPSQQPVRGQRPPISVSANVRALAAQGRSARVIVGVRSGTNLQEVVARLPAPNRARKFESIPFFAGEISPNTLLQLESDPDVISIEEDRLLQPTLAQSVPLIGGTTAWASGYTGAGWTVAIIDTGVDYTHPFLAGKMVSEACYSSNLCPGGVTSSTAPGSGLNCSTTSVSSTCFHGTHVAGIAVGNGTNSGVARDGKLIAIQVFTQFGTSLSAFTSDIIAGLNRVFALRGSFNIASVNMSLGGGSFTSGSVCDANNVSTKAAIDQLRSVGIATVVASGNDGFPNAMSAPGCISTAVSVGSTTKSDVMSSFTNVAPFLKLLAPGGGSPGTSITSSTPGGGFVGAQGTSMATPHVAGAWAVLKQKFPSATVSQVLTALQNTGPKIADNRSGATGALFPRIQLNAALDAVGDASLVVDTPASGATVPEPFVVSGWSIDPSAGTGTGVDAVHVYLYPRGSTTPSLGQVATYGSSRPDIGSIFGSRFTNSGFFTTIQGLPGGAYDMTVFGRSTATNTFSLILQRSITITAPLPPTVTIDTPGASALQPFNVSGWAIDQSASSGSGVDQVHVYLFPNGGGPPVLGVVSTYGATRPDIGNIFGSRFTNSGFSATVRGVPNGIYQLTVYARSTRTGNFDGIAQRTITVSSAPPALTIDTPVSSAGQPFTVSGWSVDPAVATGTGVDQVHVYLFPNGSSTPLLGKVTTYGTSRPDIGNIFGSQFTNSGFTTTIQGVPNGTYQLTAYARRTATGSFDLIVSRTIVVTGYVAPALIMDQPFTGASVAQPFIVSGWSIDPAASSGTGVDAVHVYAFRSGSSTPALGVASTYGTSRPDIGNIFGSQFTNSGYSATLQGLQSGSYTITAFGRTTATGAFNLVLSRTITVQ